MHAKYTVVLDDGNWVMYKFGTEWNMRQVQVWARRQWPLGNYTIWDMEHTETVELTEEDM